MSKLTIEALGHNILPVSWRRSAIISFINPLPSPGPLVTCLNPACLAARAVFRPTAYTGNDLNDTCLYTSALQPHTHHGTKANESKLDGSKLHGHHNTISKDNGLSIQRLPKRRRTQTQRNSKDNIQIISRNQNKSIANACII